MNIQAIYISKREVEDRLVWPNARMGTLTPILVYRRLRETTQENMHTTDRERSHMDDKKWAKIWQGRTAPKVNFFIWQAGHQAISVQTILEQRWVNVTQRCLFCNKQEDVEHALMRCEWARCAWLGGMDIRWEMIGDTDRKDWFGYILQMDEGTGK